MSPQELQNLLNPVIAGHDVALQMNQANSQLTIVLNRLTESSQIDYSTLADQIMSTIREADAKNIETVRFYGRKKGSKQMEWQESCLLIESAKPSQSKLVKDLISNTVKTTKTNQESTFQRAFDRFRLVQETVSAIALLGILSILVFNALIGQKTQAVAWEYQIDSVPDLLFDETMNELGAEGWELVFARRAQDSITDDFIYECIFKRKKHQDFVEK